ncbi:uncharacterized protein TRAVEDRAFT_27946 [Trametes versicolor FP-101664 SS1]|uniref:uncharacterized protein n=1 Tax=Trametes versicolor (strain FP-101664) TaxID=717944 RepID=UPI00046249BF|nr:uncharacterized protein TRAVEDRAFT_27946 [Trametes versicolor FP-101664 SS1]EIW60327.1 hypothetical protein TRAVEDRAFT_27946 [Trametes versicolor FP-101664 SS1]
MSSRTKSPLAKCLLVFVALFGIFFSHAAAMPSIALEKRDVYTPPVLYPHAGTVWYKGQTHNVTWDVSDPPANITNPIASLMLRKGQLPTPLILANNFSILLGRIEVTVPWVTEGDDYIVVLFGDSGDWSQEFTIKE